MVDMKNIIERFKIMDLGQEKYRKRKLEKIEEKGICEHCECDGKLKWRFSATCYSFDPIRDLENPNRKLFLCDECAENYYMNWQNMWDEISR